MRDGVLDWSCYRRLAGVDPKSAGTFVQSQIAKGRLSLLMSRLAGYTDDPGAIAAGFVVPSPDSDIEWLRGLEAWGDEAVRRAALVLIHLPLVSRYLVGRELWIAVRLFDQWEVCPCDDHLSAVREATAALKDPAVTGSPQVEALFAARGALLTTFSKTEALLEPARHLGASGAHVWRLASLCGLERPNLRKPVSERLSRWALGFAQSCTISPPE